MSASFSKQTLPFFVTRIPLSMRFPSHSPFNSCIFHELEAHIMYLSVSSWFLSSFMHLSGPIKFIYAPVLPPPTVWALIPPSWALVHKTTYAPMIYTALCIMFWMCAYSLLCQEGVGPWKSHVFWAPNSTRLYTVTRPGAIFRSTAWMYLD